MPPIINAHNQQPTAPPETLDSLQIDELNSCAVSAEIARLAETQPKEIARLVYEASSPEQVMFEEVAARELFPDAPILAPQVLDDLNLEATAHNGHGEDDEFSREAEAQKQYRVALPVPYLGFIRAVNAQDVKNPQTASGVEVLLQETLLYNFSSKSLDAGRDTRDSLALTMDEIEAAKSLNADEKAALMQRINRSPRRPDKAEACLRKRLEKVEGISREDKAKILATFSKKSSGLTQEEQLMMERIMEDGLQLENVTYQQLENAPEDEAGYDPGSHLVAGYAKPFSRIRHDVAQALEKSPHQVLANLVSPEANGAFQHGHVVRVLTSRPNPQNPKTLEFLVHDSATGREGPQWLHESALIPRIHHITLQQADAETAWEETRAVSEATPSGLLSSLDANDTHYHLSFSTPPADTVHPQETPYEYHQRLHRFRNRQAEQIAERLKQQQLGPSQSRIQSAPVQWHG